MKRGFTLLELILVIIIVGILATIGIAQYGGLMEKARKTEAKDNLGVLRKLQLVYYQESASGYTSTIGTGGLDAGLPTVGPTCTNTSYYFYYSCDSTNGTCTASRCTLGGKTPQGTGYTLTLAIDGTMGGTGTGGGW